MYQVLLVDDEPLVRNVLRTLSDWKAKGFEICGEAGSGRTALELIGQTSPDIAIIDVNMPEMNGVELNRAIRERFPAVRTIMLSSYDDYDYVRDCLQNGAVDYLLKHRLDEAALTNVLNKAAAELSRKDPTEKAEEPNANSGETNADAVREAIVRAVKGSGGGAGDELEAEAARSGLYPGAVRYAAAALQITPFLLLTESYSDVQTSRLMRQVVELAQQTIGEIRERTAAYVENGRLAVVFASGERSEHAVAAEAERWMSKLRHALELLLNLKSVYAVGHVCGSLSQLAASYASAERSLDAAHAGPEASRGRPAAGTERAPEPGPRVSLKIEEQKQLLLHLEMLDEEGAKRLIGSVFGSIRHLPIHSQAAQTIVSELLHTGVKALGKWVPAPSLEEAIAELPPRGELGRIGGMAELEAWLQRYYSVLLKQLKRRRTAGPHSRHVSQAIAFVLENYTGSVTLELTAAAIGLNPSYLSRIFKEETRTTFSEYVNKVRIEAGRKLLESGEYSVKQISNLVGFATYNYFFKVFKEGTGMTPNEYASSLGRGAGAG
ncbi:response regulator [Cohnella zeiphila]|uniref:Response regulator n=1 Tax=Cohnella zeiphila TaxID=2761120 RepID=A0A7X0SPP4_9BACL|nr:response regulator [Cohnella zeiphila]MBB6731568.1 response regulator [Cohnella zeiphila]